MGILDFLMGPNINKEVEEYKNTKDAVLIDVRNVDEYRGGHIPESRNIPLPKISSIEAEVMDKDTPLFVYCYSGSRSSSAVKALKQMGYTNVKNIGGISSYKGKRES